jgi:hypothetical protein
MTWWRPAGWLASHVLRKEGGHELVWTEQGFVNAFFIREVAADLGLAGGDSRPLAFDTLCRGGAFPGAGVIGDLDPELAEEWRKLVDELGYAGNEDLLLGLVHVVNYCG